MHDNYTLSKTDVLTLQTRHCRILQSVLTQAGIATVGLLSARRYRRRTTIVTTTAKTHRQIMNKKYTTTNININKVDRKLYTIKQIQIIQSNRIYLADKNRI